MSQQVVYAQMLPYAQRHSGHALSFVLENSWFLSGFFFIPESGLLVITCQGQRSQEQM